MEDRVLKKKSWPFTNKEAYWKSFFYNFFRYNYNPPTWASSSTLNVFSSKIIVPFCDKMSASEALILGILPEHNLPFSMASVIEVSKTLAKDKNAFNH